MAELHRLAEATGFTYDPERVKKIRELITLGESRPDAAIAELESMRAEMERAVTPDEDPDRAEKLKAVSERWVAPAESPEA